ncbi:MAG: hypothetical protein E4H00_09045, partial [Myxococcales bacterium]
MITGVDHVVVVVADLERATDSYERLLGLEASWRGEHPELGTANSLFRLANTYVELLSPIGPGGLGDTLRDRLASHGEGPLCLAFGTDDAGAAASALRLRGVAVPQPSEGLGRDGRSGAERRWRNFLLPSEVTRGIYLMVIEHLSPRERLPEAKPSAATNSVVGAVDHVVVMTRSAEAVISLYGDKLGLRLALDRTFPERGMRLIFFRVGGLTVECAAAGDGESSLGPFPAAADGDRFWGISYKVADIAAARERVAQAGFDVSEVRAGL